MFCHSQAFISDNNTLPQKQSVSRTDLFGIGLILVYHLILDIAIYMWKYY